MQILWMKIIQTVVNTCTVRVYFGKYWIWNTLQNWTWRKNYRFHIDIMENVLFPILLLYIISFLYNVITLSWITLNVELRYEIHTNCLGSNSISWIVFGKYRISILVGSRSRYRGLTFLIYDYICNFP